MRRQDKYPDTDIFKFLNLNSKNRITCDCVVRAISRAIGWSWQGTLKELTKFSCWTGYFITDVKCYRRFLVQNGFIEHRQLRHDDNTKYTLAEFIESHPKGTYLVNMSNHLTVVVDGVNYDVWDCTKSHQKIGMFWEMK